MSKVGLFVLNYNPDDNDRAREVLYETITSFLRNKDSNIDYQIWLMDQSPNSLEAGILCDYCLQRDINYVGLSKNLGIGGAINLFARLHDCEYTALLTSDVLITKGCDTDMLKKLDDDLLLAQISPMSQVSAIPHQETDLYVCYEFGDDKVLVLEEPGINYFIGPELTFQMWRTEILRDYHFEDKYIACYENVKFCLDVNRAGYYTGVSRDSFCWHYHNMTTKSGAIDRAFKDSDLPIDKVDHGFMRQHFKINDDIPQEIWAYNLIERI